MKKNYIMGVIACAALTMTSCSNDEIGGNNTKQGDPIEFGVYLGRDAQDSRGTIITTENLTKFGVSAYYLTSVTPDFMYNQAVNKSGDAWTYSPVKYWPTMENYGITFYAYAPHTEDANGFIKLQDNNVTGVPVINVSLPTGDNADLKQMVDFVTDEEFYQMKTNGNNKSDKITFTFNHKMTRIGLKANVSKDVYNTDAANKTKVVIRSIELNAGGEFYTSAKYKYTEHDIYTGKSNPELWYGREGDVKLNLKSILNWSDDWTIKDKVIDNSDAKNKGIALEGTSAVNLFNENQYLFLIPAKDKTNGLKANTTSATITYDIITEDSNLEDGYSKTSATKTVYLPAGIMQQGKAYNLTFTIAVDQVKLDATVDPNWDTATNSDIDVPYTPDDATPKPATPKPATPKP